MFRHLPRTTAESVVHKLIDLVYDGCSIIENSHAMHLRDMHSHTYVLKLGKERVNLKAPQRAKKIILRERLERSQVISDKEPDDFVLLLHSLNLTSTTHQELIYDSVVGEYLGRYQLRDSPTNSTQQLFLRRPQTNDYVLIFALCHCHPLLLLTSASWTVDVYIYIKPTVATDSKPHSPLRPESFCQTGFNTFCRLRILRIRNEGI